MIYLPQHSEERLMQKDESQKGEERVRAAFFL